MIKNFNWGHGITMFYIFFVGIVVTALIASFGVDHSLVVDDYYTHDLAYQTKFEKIQNSIRSNNVQINQNLGQIQISFPSTNAITGTIQFYRPSDVTQDFVHVISSPNEIINTLGKASGKWKIKIDWKEGSKPFYKEVIINL